jgi:iron complex transport system permease protein
MKKIIKFIPIIIVFLAAVVLSLMYGGVDIPFSGIFRSLVKPDDTSTISTILWHIRLPRLFAGLLAGAGLATGGCIMQTIVRNPLAEPYTLGISGGAAFGAALATMLGLSALSVFFVPLFAFAGTILSAAIIYFAASLRGFSRSALILTGVILSFFFSSLVLLIFSLSDPQKLHSTVTWLMGDLSTPNTRLLWAASSIIAAGIAVSMLFSRELDLLMLGDEKAFQIGVNSAAAKKILFIICSLMVGACVSFSGVIGFVGLVIPHLARSIVGSRHVLLLPAAAILGSAFLVASDTAARTLISPVELPVGVITGLIGGVFILVFMIASDRRVF